MKLLAVLGGGLAGACALNILHEALKKIDPEAPRMDLLGMNAIGKSLQRLHIATPKRKNLFKLSFAADIIGNTAYYSMAISGKKKNAWMKGSLSGLAAGFGAIALPRLFGLNSDYSNRTGKTRIMTTALYLTGGLVASAMARFIERKLRN